MRTFFADMHIHIGRTEAGEPVKISGGRNLTFYNIATEASERKGIDLIGIIDCHAPNVQREIIHYLETGEMQEIEGGGLSFKNTTILLGCELELRDETMRGPAHFLVYLPDLSRMQQFTEYLLPHMKNVQLSSQRAYVSARHLQQIVAELEGLLIPAHIFTPFKSIYGSAGKQMKSMLDLQQLVAVELGLSADTKMASYLSELNGLAFLSNSDAHSLGKIGREYNAFLMKRPSFIEFKKVLTQEDGRKITANYGLNPLLGKYHRTFCLTCEKVVNGKSRKDRVRLHCPDCNGTKVVKGVMDRIEEIADQQPKAMLSERPPYNYQVPLEFIPGLGAKTMERLLHYFGTEMNILHEVKQVELAEVTNENIAAYIQQARLGTLELETGGGGRYGKVQSSR